MSSKLVRAALTGVAGRMIIGYLLFKAVAVLRSEAAAAGAGRASMCTADGLRDYLNQLGRVTDEDIGQVYEHCRSEFMERNRISSAVKQAVDDWVGTDLSRAETNQIFLAYELAMTGPRPESLSDQFRDECRQMVDQFQSFRDSLEPLSSRVEINLDSLLASGSEEVNENERNLLNYVQYSQFCKTLL